MREKLQFCYKEDRKYIHGTDIFNAVHKFYQSNYGRLPSYVEMSIHHISSNNMTLVMQEDLLPSEKAAVNFSLSDNRNQVNIKLIENEDIVSCQYAYSEDKIIVAANYNKDEKAVVLSEFKDYSLIEKIVALNKGLLTEIFPDVKGKWYFTKIRLSDFNFEQQSPKKIILRLKKNLNFKLTQSDILLEDKLVGSIYFSLV